MDLEQRVIDLETKIAFQEVTIEELSSSLFEQQQAFSKLQRDFENFQKKVQAELSNEGEIRPHEKPPHY